MRKFCKGSFTNTDLVDENFLEFYLFDEKERKTTLKH